MEDGTSAEDHRHMNVTPGPAWALSVLRWFCPDELYEAIEGDLFQRFDKDMKTFGEKRARRRLLWNALRFVRGGILMRNTFSLHMNQWPVFRNYFITTFRHMGRHKINALSKVGGLTLALFSFLIISLYVHYQLSFDTYHEGYDRIYRVNTERKENGRFEKYGIAPLALGPLLVGQFPEIEAFTRLDISNGSHVRYNQKVVSCGVFPADSSLFDVFSFSFLQGNKDGLKKPGSIVLTRSASRNIFGDEEPMGKLLTINNQEKIFTVTAVIDDIPRNSHFRVDAFIPLEREALFTVDNIVSPVDFVERSAVLYVKFRKETSAGLFEEKIESLLDRQVNKDERAKAGFRIFLQPLTDIYFDTAYKYEFTRKGSGLYLYIFIVLGVFLLVVASINYINLSVADFTGRSREIGVRKVMGAGRTQIAGQVILEALFFCAAAFMLSSLLLYLFFPKVLSVLEPDLRFEMLIDKNLLIAVSLTLFLLIFFSTVFPAYWLATSHTTQDLKGVSGSVRHTTLGRTLLIAQFAISAICISATFVISRQLDFIHTKDLGFDKRNLVVLLMPEDFTVAKMKTFKQQLKSIPGVQAVSNSSFRIGGGYWKDWYEIESEGEMKPVELHEVFSDDDLFGTLGIKLLEGRLFNADYPADSGAAFVINETAAKVLGWKDPVGKRILTHPEEKGKWEGTVVGVVSDFNISSLHEKVQPLVMRLPWQRDYPEYFVYVRISGNEEQVVAAIKSKYNEMVPGYPIDLEYVIEFFNKHYERENRAFASMQFGTTVIILVSSIGIFSLSVFMSLRRMKEFGIRKVLGANVFQIMALHVGYFLRLAVLANVIALPVSYWLMKGWLDGFAYRAPLNAMTFLSVMAISFLLVVVSGGYSAWKAAIMNPVDVIKLQ